jgi:hypothetical protein
VQRTPRLAGAFLFEDFPSVSAANAIKVNAHADVGTFFREPWNQMLPKVLNQPGLGSMSLILLPHLLFTSICDWTARFYGARSHTGIQIRASSS